MRSEGTRRHSFQCTVLFQTFGGLPTEEGRSDMKIVLVFLMFFVHHAYLVSLFLVAPCGRKVSMLDLVEQSR